MFLKRFLAQRFRNLQDVDVSFDPNVNIFIGKNAQGKTNLLEAISFLASTRSHRTSNDKELIAFGQEYAKLSGTVQKSQVELDLRVLINKKGKKVWVNRLEQAKISAYVGRLNVVLFSPSDLELLKGAPAVRRRFMDKEFGQVNASYLYYASNYRQVLQQRNNYLKQLQFKRDKDLIFLSVLSDQLAGLAAEVIVRRFQYLTFLNQVAQKAYSQISEAGEALTLSYRPSIPGISKHDSTEAVYQTVKAYFEAQQAQEVKKGTTLAGPHRDDLEFDLDGSNAHAFASQGQQRSIALSLKLAEIQLVQHLTHEYPLLLLDDVMSELDHDRQRALLGYLHGKTQTFITTTDLTGISWEIIKQPRVYHIAAGKIKFVEGVDHG